MSTVTQWLSHFTFPRQRDLMLIMQNGNFACGASLPTSKPKSSLTRRSCGGRLFLEHALPQYASSLTYPRMCKCMFCLYCADDARTAVDVSNVSERMENPCINPITSPGPGGRTRAQVSADLREYQDAQRALAARTSAILTPIYQGAD
eukprot:3532214-Pleurochrysis_carterae.AAC.2